jgi:hypothetical protein
LVALWDDREVDSMDEKKDVRQVGGKKADRLDIDSVAMMVVLLASKKVDWRV